MCNIYRIQFHAYVMCRVCGDDVQNFQDSKRSCACVYKNTTSLDTLDFHPGPALSGCAPKVSQRLVNLISVCKSSNVHNTHAATQHKCADAIYKQTNDTHLNRYARARVFTAQVYSSLRGWFGAGLLLATSRRPHNAGDDSSTR